MKLPIGLLLLLEWVCGRGKTSIRNRSNIKPLHFISLFSRQNRVSSVLNMHHHGCFCLLRVATQDGVHTLVVFFLQNSDMTFLMALEYLGNQEHTLLDVNHDSL